MRVLYREFLFDVTNIYPFKKSYILNLTIKHIFLILHITLFKRFSKNAIRGAINENLNFF